MPRKMRRAAPSRSVPKQQKRAASTISTPSQNAPTQRALAPQQPPKPTDVAKTANNQQPRQPGLFGQMASTAAGVAVGSTIGHTVGAGISSLFGGRRSDVQEEPQNIPQTQYEQPPYQSFQTNDQLAGATTCEADAKALTKCLEQNNHDIGLCQWYLENLKACQQLASQY